MTDAGQDEGFVVTEWAIGIVVLIVPVMLLMAVLPTWASRHEAAAAAAREATRAAVAVDDPHGARASATAAAHDTLIGRGIDVGDVMIAVDLPPVTSDEGIREGVLQVRVALPPDQVTIPLLGTLSGPTVGAAHERRLNPYRSRS